jgi:hypothetical protein
MHWRSFPVRRNKSRTFSGSLERCWRKLLIKCNACPGDFHGAR